MTNDKLARAPHPRHRARDKAKVTINDIARLANVSKKTVSRVINDSPLVRDETRQKVKLIISEHGFAPDPQARALAFRRSFLIALIYDNPSPQYVVNMQRGILDTLEGTSFQLIVRPCDRSDPSFSRACARSSSSKTCSARSCRRPFPRTSRSSTS